MTRRLGSATPALQSRPGWLCLARGATLLAGAASGLAVAGEPGGGMALHHLKAAEATFGDARIGERQTGLGLWSPEYSIHRHLFRVSANYTYTRYTYENLQTRNRDLHHLRVPLQWREASDRWRVVLTPVVAASSNIFKDLANRGSREDFDLHARWELRRWTSTTRGWRIAAVRDTAFGPPRFYPDVALLLRGERWTAELGLPSTRAALSPRDDLSFGLAIFPDGGNWHVVSDERNGAAFDYSVRTWRGAVTSGWSPWQRLRLDLQAGIEFARRHELVDDTGVRIEREAGSARYVRIEARFAL